MLELSDEAAGMIFLLMWHAITAIGAFGVFRKADVPTHLAFVPVRRLRLPCGRYDRVVGREHPGAGSQPRRTDLCRHPSRSAVTLARRWPSSSRRSFTCPFWRWELP